MDAADSLVRQARDEIGQARQRATSAGATYLDHVLTLLNDLERMPPADPNTRDRLQLALGNLSLGGERTLQEGTAHVRSAAKCLEQLADLWHLDVDL